MANFNWQNPYKRLFNRVPDYNHLRKFSFLYFITELGSHRDTFMPRYMKAIMIEYAGNHKAYKLHNMESATILVSRYVIFHEGIFSYVHSYVLDHTFVLPATILYFVDPIGPTDPSAPSSSSIPSPPQPSSPSSSLHI